MYGNDIGCMLCMVVCYIRLNQIHVDFLGFGARFSLCYFLSVIEWATCNNNNNNNNACSRNVPRVQYTVFPAVLFLINYCTYANHVQTQ